VLVIVSFVGRAVPFFALLSLLSLGAVGDADFGPFGRAGLATLITLALFALPPIVINAYEGVRGVDPDVVESARGMGLSEGEVLRRVELPLALPLIVSGVRLALVQVWATATVAALVAGPGLGRIITHGYDSNHPSEVIGGSLIVAVIALVLEVLLVLAQRAADPLSRATVPAAG
jgi:osmoprotectant transport system permease protein